MFFSSLFRKREKKAALVISSEPALVVGFDDLFGQPVRRSAVEKGHVVVVGNCLAEGITMGMASVAAATRLYDFSVIPLHLRSIEDASSKDALANASYVFAQRLGALDLKKLHELTSYQTQIHEFQDVVFRSAWPFEGPNGFEDDAMARNPASCIKDVDGALARLRKLEPNKKRRIQRYKDLDFDWAASIDRIIESQKRFLEGIDDRADFRLGHFILENYKDIQLFYSSTHPSGVTFEHYCEYVGEKLSLAETVPSRLSVDHWREWSIPVHPLIARRLGLNWADERSRYHYGPLGDITWLEWVEAYVEAFD